MHSFIKVFGGEPVCLGIVRDNEEAIKSVFKDLNGIDMIITMGGASVGEFDLITTLFEENDTQLYFHKVAMRPGKPLICGTLRGIPMLGLPGNPVSTGVTALLFLFPAICRLSGCIETTNIRTAYLGANLPKNDQRQDYIRATLEWGKRGNLIATPFAKQDSSMSYILALSDCLIIRPPQSAALQVGTEVQIMMFDEGVIRY